MTFYTKSKKSFLGAGKMAQQIRALAVPADDTGSVPSTQREVKNYLQLQIQRIF